VPHSILFSFAHPDDESFSGVGTAMLYAERGIRTALVTATRGQSGKCGEPPVCTPEELPARREQELREAAALGGIAEVHVLDYRDQALADAPRGEILRTLVGHIRRLRPAIVATFDPDGFNRHPDHVAIGRFTSDAIAAAGDARWFPETGAAHDVTRLLWTPTMPPWEAALMPDLGERPGVDFVLDIRAYRERKAAALRAHRTQHLSINRCFFDQAARDTILGIEVWRQAWGPALARRPSSDIFDGIAAV
jgi:LmbE family N-acetylglucosaminyl deacetylase